MCCICTCIIATTTLFSRGQNAHFPTLLQLYNAQLPFVFAICVFSYFAWRAFDRLKCGGAHKLDLLICGEDTERISQPHDGIFVCYMMFALPMIRAKTHLHHIETPYAGRFMCAQTSARWMCASCGYVLWDYGRLCELLIAWNIYTDVYFAEANKLERLYIRGQTNWAASLTLSTST